MDECAICGVTDNPHEGPMENPWNPGFVPGGSGGGLAITVAGGLAWAALGTDTPRFRASPCRVLRYRRTEGDTWIDQHGWYRTPEPCL